MFAGHLTQQQLGGLYDVIVRLVREGDEELLLAHLPPKFKATLPQASTFAGRLYARLHQLNSIPALVDGAVPLRGMLDALCIVYKDYQESLWIGQIRDSLPNGTLAKLARTVKRIFLGLAIASVLLTAGYIYVRVEHPSLLGGSEGKGDEGPAVGGTSTGKRRETAPRSSTCAYPGSWVKLRGDDVEWRLKSIENQRDKLVAMIQVRNTNAQSTKFFYDFRRSPLALIDRDTGNYHAMLSTSDTPDGLEVQSDSWGLQGRRVLELIAEFQPLTPGATSAQILYAKHNFAQPIELCVPKK